MLSTSCKLYEEVDLSVRKQCGQWVISKEVKRLGVIESSIVIRLSDCRVPNLIRLGVQGRFRLRFLTFYII